METSNNFNEDSIEKLIFDFWSDYSITKHQFEQQLSNFSKEELVEFIMNYQSKNAFGKGLIHP